jgi:hypothetical protein
VPALSRLVLAQPQSSPDYSIGTTKIQMFLGNSFILIFLKLALPIFSGLCYSKGMEA